MYPEAKKLEDPVAFEVILENTAQREALEEVFVDQSNVKQIRILSKKKTEAGDLISFRAAAIHIAAVRYALGKYGIQILKQPKVDYV